MDKELTLAERAAIGELSTSGMTYAAKIALGVENPRPKDSSEKRPTYTPQSYSTKELAYYPDWICKNGCGKHYPSNTPHTKSPCCGTPLIRYIRYEEKR